MRKRRYEILLPRKHNDGRLVVAEAFELTREELMLQFGAHEFLPHITLGSWVHKGRRYEDELFRIIVDVDDLEENRQWFARFKEILRDRFEQVEIYIASYSVDIV